VTFIFCDIFMFYVLIRRYGENSNHHIAMRAVQMAEPGARKVFSGLQVVV